MRSSIVSFAKRFLVTLAVYLSTFGIVLPPSVAPRVWGLPPSPAQAAPGSSGADVGGDTGAELDALEARLNESFRAARLGLRDLPRETFDPAALARKLRHDPPAASALLRERTRLVPYRGVLRGARGVLMDGTGNALDRALLLAALLDDGEREIRLARVRLTPDVVESLLIPLVRADAKDGADSRELEEDRGGNSAASSEALANLRLRVEKHLELIAERVASQVPALAAATATSGAASGSSGADPNAALADHWWVRYRDAQGEWIDLDLTRGDGATVPEPDETFGVDELPDTLFHRVTIRVVVEQLQDRELTRGVPLEHTLRIADAHALDAHLSFVPLNWPSDLQLFGEIEVVQRDLKAAVAAQSEWLPVLTYGDESVRQGSFYDTGDVNRNPNITIQTKKLAKAQSALSGLGDGGRKGVLSASWVEYDVEVPGEASRTERRTLFDLVDPRERALPETPELTLDPRKRLERGLALVGTIDLLLLGGQLNTEYVTDLGLRKLLANRRGALGVIEAGRRDRALDVTAQLSKFKPFSGQLYALAMLRHRANPARDGLFIDEANVLTHATRSALGPDGEPVAYLVFDIVANHLDALPSPSGDRRRLRLEQGVIDTVAEAVLAERRPSETAENTSHIFAASTSRGVAWRTVRTADDPLLASPGIPERSRQALQRDLAGGYAVVVPEDASGDAVFSWWRVRGDGQTLGMVGGGEGAGVPVYIVLLGLVVTALTTFLVSTLCLKAEAGVKCYVCAGFFGVTLGLFLSWAIASIVPTLTVTAKITVSVTSVFKTATAVSAALSAACGI